MDSIESKVLDTTTVDIQCSVIQLTLSNFDVSALIDGRYSPKAATVCKEFYKMSKNGRCIKNKKAIEENNAKLFKDAFGSFSSSTVPKPVKVCKEFYKMSKNGRCIKNKKAIQENNAKFFKAVFGSVSSSRLGIFKPKYFGRP